MTDSGLGVMIAGFALAWIPYVLFLGDLLLLIGIVLLLVGRRAFDESHQWYVAAGGTLVLVGFLGALLAGFYFAVPIAVRLTMTGLTPSQLAPGLRTDLFDILLSGAVLGTIGRLGTVLLVYRLSSRSIHRTLWGAFASGEILSFLSLWYLWSLVGSAVDRATSGSSVALGPIQQFLNTSTVVGLVSVVPCLLFAWAYHRTREMARNPPGNVGPRATLPLVA